jgi:hypothetical protein
MATVGGTDMPPQKRPGKRHLYVEIPETLGEQLDELAKRNRRTITAEVVLALEKHLAGNGYPSLPATHPPTTAEGKPNPKKRAKGGKGKG